MMQAKPVYPPPFPHVEKKKKKKRYCQDTWRKRTKKETHRNLFSSPDYAKHPPSHQCLEGEDDRDDELDEFDDVLPLRSGIFSGVGERDDANRMGEGAEGAAGLAASVVAVWRRDWFHDV